MQKRLKTGSKPPLVLSAQENKCNTETQGLMPNIPPCGTHHKYSGTILAIICPLNRWIISCKQYKAPDHIVFDRRLLGPKPARIWHRIFGEVIQMGKFCLRIPGGEAGSPGNSALLFIHGQRGYTSEVLAHWVSNWSLWGLKEQNSSCCIYYTRERHSVS